MTVTFGRGFLARDFLTFYYGESRTGAKVQREYFFAVPQRPEDPASTALEPCTVSCDFHLCKRGAIGSNYSEVNYRRRVIASEIIPWPMSERDYFF